MSNPNPFTEHFSKQPDHVLENILIHQYDYDPLAVEAARVELERRGIQTADFKSISQNPTDISERSHYKEILKKWWNKNTQRIDPDIPMYSASSLEALDYSPEESQLIKSHNRWKGIIIFWLVIFAFELLSSLATFSLAIGTRLTLISWSIIIITILLSAFKLLSTIAFIRRIRPALIMLTVSLGIECANGLVRLYNFLPSEYPIKFLQELRLIELLHFVMPVLAAITLFYLLKSIYLTLYTQTRTRLIRIVISVMVFGSVYLHWHNSRLILINFEITRGFLFNQEPEDLEDYEVYEDEE